MLRGACPSCDQPLPVLVDYTSTFLPFFIVFIRKCSLFVCWQQEAYSGTLLRKAEKDLPDWLWTPKPLNSSWQLLHSHAAHFSSNPGLFFSPACLSVSQSHLPPLSDIQSTGSKGVCLFVQFPLLMQPPTGEQRILATGFVFCFLFFQLRWEFQNVRNLWDSIFHHSLGILEF